MVGEKNRAPPDLKRANASFAAPANPTGRRSRKHRMRRTTRRCKAGLMPRGLGQVNRAQGLERGVFATAVKLEAERHGRAGGEDRDSAEPRGQCSREAWVVLPIV